MTKTSCRQEGVPSFSIELVSIMFMRNPEHAVPRPHDDSTGHGEPHVASTSLEMMFGQMVLIALFALAILLRTLA
ncbi:hypothetical protein NZK35_10260 [Stieleria sp. ICT_E10.1]|uniref:hypothetical protein n=1 Tax=Stieleria sedimenti TaxID=2976331 RepID=UPI00217F740F|nr:hypothetical protein [Stieleria sedimenti]MCS7467029.1 hypothetical protein [Stieleria sedimenti]